MFRYGLACNRTPLTAALQELMNAPATVLLVGNHPLLLDTRAAILAHFWSVTITSGPDLEHSANVLADLVVICHSVPQVARTLLVTKLNAITPKPLIVTLNTSDARPEVGADRSVNTSAGPGLLVSEVYGLLTEHGLGSKNWPQRQPS